MISNIQGANLNTMFSNTHLRAYDLYMVGVAKDQTHVNLKLYKLLTNQLTRRHATR